MLLQRRQRLLRAVLGPGVDQEAPGFVARRIEHARQSLQWGYGRRRLGLAAEFAQVADRALGTFRSARDARVPAVQDQPVMRVLLEFVGDEFQEPLLDFVDVLAGREAGPVGDAEDVRVHGDRRLAEGGVQHDVGRLAPDARQRLERVARRGNVAAVFADEDFRQCDDVLRLVAEEPDGVDVRDQAVDAELHDGGGRVRDRKEAGGGLVDALVGRLRGQHDGHQQFERRQVRRARSSDAG